MGKRLRTFALNALLFCASIAVSLAGLEIGLRWFSPQVLKLDLSRWIVPDPDVRFSFKPNLQVHVRRPGIEQPVEFDFFTDEFGLRRGATPRSLRQEGALNILWLGDSQTWGWGVEYEESYPMLTTTLLMAHGAAPVYSLNAGVCGYSQDTEYLLLKKLRPYVEPNLAVLTVDIQNDFWEIKDSQLFHLEGNALKRNDQFSPFVIGLDEIRNKWGWKAYCKAYIKSRSHAFIFFADRTRPLRRWLFPPVPSRTTQTSLESFYIHPEQLYYSPATKDVEHVQKIMGSLILEIKNVLWQTWRAPLMVVILPGRLQVREGRIPIPPGYTADLLAPHRFLRNWCSEHNLAFVDMLETLQTAYDAGEHVYWMDGHYTQVAHRRIAERLLEALSHAPFSDDLNFIEPQRIRM